MIHSAPQKIRKIACEQDESAFTVLMMVCTGSILSILVIFIEMGTAKQISGFIKIQHIALTFSTLMASWLLVPTAFAIHYAHLYYLAPADAIPINFPEKNLPESHPLNKSFEPNYWDFLYFSFTIAAASQTADVSISTTKLRRLVLLQSILSFAFNITILGLFINVSASLI